MSSGRPRVVFNMHIFVSCQIDIENKQLFSPLDKITRAYSRKQERACGITKKRQKSLMKGHNCGF